MDFLVAIALGDALAADLVPRRKMAKGSDQALELEQVRILLVELGNGCVRALLQDARILSGIHGKAMVVVVHVEFTALVVKDKLQLAALQYDSIMIREHWN